MYSIWKWKKNIYEVIGLDLACHHLICTITTFAKFNTSSFGTTNHFKFILAINIPIHFINKRWCGMVKIILFVIRVKFKAASIFFAPFSFQRLPFNLHSNMRTNNYSEIGIYWSMVGTIKIDSMQCMKFTMKYYDVIWGFLKMHCNFSWKSEISDFSIKIKMMRNNLFSCYIKKSNLSIKIYTFLYFSSSLRDSIETNEMKYEQIHHMKGKHNTYTNFPLFHNRCMMCSVFRFVVSTETELDHWRWKR